MNDITPVARGLRFVVCTWCVLVCVACQETQRTLSIPTAKAVASKGGQEQVSRAQSPDPQIAQGRATVPASAKAVEATPALPLKVGHASRVARDRVEYSWAMGMEMARRPDDSVEGLSSRPRCPKKCVGKKIKLDLGKDPIQAFKEGMGNAFE